MAIYRGDCHVHTHRSHGADLTPERIVAEAHAAGLDFIAVTDHQAAFEPSSWTDSGLLIIPGQEVLTPDGHWLALGLPPGVVVDSVAAARRFGALCVVAHPHAPYPGGTFRGRLGDFDAIEVWNGRWHSDLPWQADNESALATWAGGHLPALGNSDAHLAGQLGSPQLVVEAPTLTAPAVLAAIRAGHSWIAGSRAVQVDVTVTADRMTARISGAPAGTAVVHTEHGPIHRERLPENGSKTVSCALGTVATVRLEVRHPDGRMAALTNHPVVTSGPERAGKWHAGWGLACYDGDSASSSSVNRASGTAAGPARIRQ
ncbi:CehA/McbA family metallohydrolase [Actinoplanes sp. G11-F43]|uniref:CehA/McbA family metallohydrolase n=1 Tax=Actinoplanes sp. G11-F43 TaxID=3424130 RepID=UPI003D3391BC